MKKLFKTNLLVLAMLFAIGTAFAFKIEKSNSTDQKWANMSGSYINVTGLEQSDEETVRDYSCTGLETICTEEYPAGVNPNDQENDSFPGTALPTNQIFGVYNPE